ncbi:zinc-ribbon domain-containing protein [Roseobacter sp. CCS2]|uniref:zinc-ribbon domain-containing protein n=1 Tax=Roseobacter sp. CCS2 TaxID=391593 RepID=UPI0000F3E548|nr:zinc-ribbon domain-containing protein [Roseobacter sp. CCS2]EBA12107.1 MJ0042 family finger-like domain protein [Roseobacter sp. CCS2]
MRLICPNCDAQYEVSDDAIPPGGRDVQCSNCQLSWFQTEKPTVPGREKAQDDAKPSDDATTADEVDAKDNTDQEGAETETEDTSEPVNNDTTSEEPELAPAPQRRPLDDAVASILREEAALGATASVASSAIATPPATEAAKPPAPVTADETRQRIAQMTADEGGTSTAGTAKSSAADDASADAAHLRTVPSINEINATLRARAQANDTSGLTEAEKEEAVQRKGFRRGFFFVLIILAILILPYVFADIITENLPQTTGVMASYVTMVDQLRVALNDMISGFTAE